MFQYTDQTVAGIVIINIKIVPSVFKANHILLSSLQTPYRVGKVYYLHIVNEDLRQRHSDLSKVS